MKKKIRPNSYDEVPRSLRPSVPVKIATATGLILALIYFLFPIYWVIIASTKSPAQLVDGNTLWFSTDLANLPQAFATNYSRLLGWTRNNFWRWVLNSIIYSTSAAVIGTVLAVMGGYATAKFDFWGKRVVVGIVMAALLMPAVLLTIPQYSIFHSLGLTNTPFSVIIPSCISPLGFFLGRVYAQSSVPTELIEAARIDGAGEARIFFTMVVRILAPAMVTIFLFLFVATWNNFIVPLMMISDETLNPITLGLYGLVSNRTFDDRGALMLGALMGVLPTVIMFLVLQRFWQSGLTAGSVKE